VIRGAVVRERSTVVLKRASTSESALASAGGVDCSRSPQFSSADKDFRYMATSDLPAGSKPEFSLDGSSESKVYWSSPSWGTPLAIYPLLQ
jgi:hypothetical protein